MWKQILNFRKEKCLQYIVQGLHRLVADGDVAMCLARLGGGQLLGPLALSVDLQLGPGLWDVCKTTLKVSLK